MKTIKGLILGSAASILAMGAAQAADLPVKAKAVEYVKICSLYGAGFYYIPGTADPSFTQRNHLTPRNGTATVR